MGICGLPHAEHISRMQCLGACAGTNGDDGGGGGEGGLLVCVGQLRSHSVTWSSPGGLRWRDDTGAGAGAGGVGEGVAVWWTSPSQRTPTEACFLERLTVC